MTLEEVLKLKAELKAELRAGLVPNPDTKIAERVVRRFMAFKYQPKEKKKSKVDRLSKLIRDKTGIGRGTAEDIADAIVRGREVERLARQKGWPVEGGVITGPSGELSFGDLRGAL